MCYYSLSLGVRTLPGNLYLNNFISITVEGIGYAGCFVIPYWGRKWPTVAVFMGAAAALLVSALVSVFIPGIDKCSIEK